jgi:hypothetical protein
MAYFPKALLALSIAFSAPIFASTCAQLWRLAKEMPEQIKGMAVSPESVTAVVSSCPGGCFAKGAFIVQTQQGRKFLKLYTFASPHEMAAALAVQVHLAKRELAPGLTGVIQPHDISKLLERQPLLAKPFDGDHPTFGVLMDEVPDFWTIQRLESPPPEFRNWDLDKIERQLDKIDLALKEGRILAAADMQIAVTKQGDVAVIDFDLYHLVSEDGQVLGFHSPNDQPIDSMRVHGFKGSWREGQEQGLAISATSDERKILRELRTLQRTMRP